MNPNNRTELLANCLRKHVLEMIYKSNSSHIGSCYSIADILAVLYEKILNVCPNNFESINRDRFILSKGHAAAVLYAVLAERKFFPIEDLKTFNQDQSLLSGHVSHKVNGVEVSTGSLGHGLSIGCGMALAAKINKQDYKTYVLISDGECDEGSIWEAILFAGHHKLNNLIAIVDYNKIQSLGDVKDVLDLDPLADKWMACGWHVMEVDGHSHCELEKTFKSIENQINQPTVVIAHTVKGKGVSFMENKLLWHYRSPSDEQLQLARSELESQYA